jgi:hypothetical protein
VRARESLVRARESLVRARISLIVCDSLVVYRITRARLRITLMFVARACTSDSIHNQGVDSIHWIHNGRDDKPTVAERANDWKKANDNKMVSNQRKSITK